MRVRVGGLPQCNRNGSNGAELRQGTIRAQARTLVLRCHQKHRRGPLAGQRFDRCAPSTQPLRGAPGAILLIDSQVDHSAGQLILRDRAPPGGVWHRRDLR